MLSPDYSKRSYLLPNGCKDLIEVIELHVGEKTSVAELAMLLGQRPAQVIADLMLLGVFATATQTVAFEKVKELAQKYGYTAKRSQGYRG